MTAIAIADVRWGIARDGRQVLFIPEDLAFFRAKTEGNVVVMGRKTLAALPGGMPLAGRTTVVLTHGDGAGLPAGCVAANMETLPKVLAACGAGRHIYVAGGGEVYRLLLPQCGDALVTRVFTDSGADTFFPNLDEDGQWQVLRKSDVKCHEGLQYQFLQYRRRS